MSTTTNCKSRHPIGEFPAPLWRTALSGLETKSRAPFIWLLRVSVRRQAPVVLLSPRLRAENLDVVFDPVEKPTEP